MPANDPRDFHIDSLLTNLLIGFAPVCFWTLTTGKI
jgi:hypothetical protein